jgi:hypothetical protein
MEEGIRIKNSPDITSGENFDNCGREHLVVSIPPVVVALPRVDVPLAVVGVPVHVHDAGTLSYPEPSIPPSVEYSSDCILLGTSKVR